MAEVTSPEFSNFRRNPSNLMVANLKCADDDHVGRYLTIETMLYMKIKSYTKLWLQLFKKNFNCNHIDKLIANFPGNSNSYLLIKVCQ